MNFDLIIKNANIYTLDYENNTGRWLGISQGKITAIGSSDDSPTEANIIIDLLGKTIIPGFIDTHVHGSLTGEALSGVSLEYAESTEEILYKVKKHSEENSDQNIISANSFSEIHLKNGERPTSAQLDEISKDQIIVIYDKSYHGCILNSRGIEAGKLSPQMAGVGCVDGKMTGHVHDDTSYYFAIQNIMKNITSDTVKRYMKVTNDYALSKGVTSIHSLDGGDFVSDMPAWIIHKDSMDLHVVNYWETLDFEKVEPFGLPRIGGCICLDGTRVLRTMALMEPYNDKPSTRGSLYYKDKDIYHFVKTANDKNMQCAMHATGDRAIDQYIYILDEVIKEFGQKHLRHRIEHFSMPTEKHIEMAVELELALPMQPIFKEVWGEGENSLYKQRFGEQRAMRIEPIAKIVRAGGMVCGGSDSPVTMMDPIEGMWACVNNKDSYRNVSIEEALRIFTSNGAWAAHEEHERGSIEIGKSADLVVLSQNPFDNPKNLREIRVEKTFVRGKLLYEAEKS